MRLLLINPNTSVHITKRMAASARAVFEPGDMLTAITASAGPEVVRNAELLAQADANAITLAAAHAPGHDAIVLGISLDGVARRLRALHPAVPVVGMTEAALLTACLRTERLGLLTLGASLLPLYRQGVERLGLEARVVAYQAPESTSAFAAGPAWVDAELLELLAAASERLRHDGAQSIVLGGAVLCGYAPALALACAMPVFDGVACAVGQARLLVAQAALDV